MIEINSKALIPEGVLVEENVVCDPRVIFAGKNIVLRRNVRLDAACLISDGVTIGQGAWVRAGAVVLQSVPPNAIVEGNPAYVVGYVAGSEMKVGGGDSTVIDATSFSKLDRPAKVPLNVKNCAVYLMRKVVDARGSLTVGEVPTEVPFLPSRYFIVYGVPSIELRGEHAHRRCQQFLICVHGSLRVMLDDGIRRCEVLLDRPDMGIFMPEMIWGTQYRASQDAVLLVFASRPYEVDDYIRTYDEFMSECN